MENRLKVNVSTLDVRVVFHDLSSYSAGCQVAGMSVAHVMAFIDPENPLAAEILQEAGEAYFSGCKKMVAALEALRAFDRAVAPATYDSRQQVTHKSQLLDEAAERVHFVLIQREAMQLSGSETFFEDYEVPLEVITRLGQRRWDH